MLQYATEQFKCSVTNNSLLMMMLFCGPKLEGGAATSAPVTQVLRMCTKSNMLLLLHTRTVAYLRKLLPEALDFM
jgi:hypothetical protein